jgi:hypothetical protein
MPTHDENGFEYEYWVDETAVPENFEKSLNGMTVTNTYGSPNAPVTANKVWMPVDLLDSLKEEVEFQLYRKVGSGTPETVGTAQKVNAAGEWKYTWADMPTHDANGNEYTYFVREVTVPANFTADTDDDLTVTNTYGSPNAPVTANKVWMPVDLLALLKKSMQLVSGSTPGQTCRRMMRTVMNTPTL